MRRKTGEGGVAVGDPVGGVGLPGGACVAETNISYGITLVNGLGTDGKLD